jgi:hypothetical protein
MVWFLIATIGFWFAVTCPTPTNGDNGLPSLRFWLVRAVSLIAWLAVALVAFFGAAPWWPAAALVSGVLAVWLIGPPRAARRGRAILAAAAIGILFSSIWLAL